MNDSGNILRRIPFTHNGIPHEATVFESNVVIWVDHPEVPEHLPLMRYSVAFNIWRDPELYEVLSARKEPTKAQWLSLLMIDRHCLPLVKAYLAAQ